MAKDSYPIYKNMKKSFKSMIKRQIPNKNGQRLEVTLKE